MSRQEAHVRQVGLPGQEDFGSRLVTADVAGLRFTTVYVPNGKSLEHADFERKLAWLDTLAQHFAEGHSPGDQAVLCGDFNIAPEALDSWDEEQLAGSIFHTESERGRFAYLLEWGLIDLFRHHHPGEKMFSWWDYRAGSFYRNHGLRIDFLLGTRAIADRLAAAARRSRLSQEGGRPDSLRPRSRDRGPELNCGLLCESD